MAVQGPWGSGSSLSSSSCALLRLRPEEGTTLFPISEKNSKKGKGIAIQLEDPRTERRVEESNRRALPST